MPRSIALVATGSPSEQQQVEKAQEIIAKRYDCPVIFGDETHTGTEASLRAARFIEHCLNDELTHLWVTRGGEGSADLLPFIEERLEEIKAAQPKMLIGLSDYTPILVYFAQKMGWPCVHGMCALQFARNTPDDETLTKTDQLIEGNLPSVIDNLTALNDLALSAEVSGKPTGGNLTLCSISMKDCWEIDTDDKILFFEDWMDKGYRVNRTLKYFERLGLFKTCRAVIFGDFFAAKFSDDTAEQQMQTDYLNNVLKRFAARQTFPVYFTKRIGHGKANDPIVLNHETKLQRSHCEQSEDTTPC